MFEFMIFHHMVAAVDDNMKQWHDIVREQYGPLLLTWFNFNPGMNK